MKKRLIFAATSEFTELNMGKLADSLKQYFEETPQDILDREWEELKHLNSIGPDVLAYAERVRTFYGPLMNTVSSTACYPPEPFLPEDHYYLAA